MGEEQGQDHLLHHPHLRPQWPIAEAVEDSVEGEDKAAMHTRLAQLQSMYDQQYQVRNVMTPSDMCLCLHVDGSQGEVE